MKILKGFSILLFAVALGSCFDPPEFPNVPQIEFDRVEFFDGGSTDSLVLNITFQDGNGDLGLDAGSLEHLSYPYNNHIFYQANNGSLSPIQTFAGSSTENVYLIMDIPDPGLGKLVFPRTRKDPTYSSLPAYEFPEDCINYEYVEGLNLLIAEEDIAVLDDFTEVTDTLFSQNGRYFQIRDTLHVTINPNFYNIEVDFLVKDPGNPNADENGYVEFDWKKEFCQSFDGRFPILSDNNSALEGTLRYAMYSLGFKELFSVKTLKLRVQIKDRALNQSNWVESHEFTLDQI